MRHVHIAVLGGGITGQLVQFHVPEAEVYDWQTAMARRRRPLTRQWGANYLWKPLDGIECRSFPVVTTVDGSPPTLHAVSRYKDKIGKSGDVVGWERQFQHEMTGYDFVRLPDARITWEHRAVSIDRTEHVIEFADQESVRYDTLVSTVPLYALLSLLGMPEPTGRLKMKPIFFKVTARPPDAPYPLETMYVNYISDPAIPPYRFSDRMGERHYESIVPFEGPSSRRYAPGKIFPHPQVPEFLDVLRGYGIHTFGRYGSWNPDELIHETWDRIVEWKGDRHGYFA